MNLFTKLYWMKRASSVVRFHGVVLTHPETVMHHSGNVTLILSLVYGERCTVPLLRAAIQHDHEELVIGDVPAPSKIFTANDSNVWKNLEKEIQDFFEILEPNLSEQENKMLKGADFIDAVFTCLIERLRGNVEINWVFQNYCDIAVKGALLVDQPEMLDLWVQIYDSYTLLQNRNPLPVSVENAERANFWLRR